jgi:hypothetical protein
MDLSKDFFWNYLNTEGVNWRIYATPRRSLELMQYKMRNEEKKVSTHNIMSIDNLNTRTEDKLCDFRIQSILIRVFSN